MPAKNESVKARKRREQQERAHRRWTKGEEAQLEREVRNGMWLDDIAARHKRSTQGIEARAVKLGIGPVRRRPAASGTSRAVRSASPASTAPRAKSTKKSLLSRLFGR